VNVNILVVLLTLCGLHAIGHRECVGTICRELELFFQEVAVDGAHVPSTFHLNYATLCEQESIFSITRLVSELQSARHVVPDSRVPSGCLYRIMKT
jgi:hypothetical protein